MKNKIVSLLSALLIVGCCTISCFAYDYGSDPYTYGNNYNPPTTEDIADSELNYANHPTDDATIDDVNMASLRAIANYQKAQLQEIKKQTALMQGIKNQLSIMDARLAYFEKKVK